MRWFNSQSTAPIPQAQAHNVDGFDEVHTPSNPYCPNASCPKCHANAHYHELIHHGHTDDDRPYTFFSDAGYHNRVPEHTSTEVEQAFSFFGIGRRGGH